MAGETPFGLIPSQTPGAQIVEREPGVWRLQIPAGPRGKYRLAQLDDYGDQPRSKFARRAPFSLKLRARASSGHIPGTWGFGLWNNPFGMAIMRGVEVLRLPALPNAAWYFFASPPNYLSLRDDLPARGRLAACFRSPNWPAPLLALAAPAGVLAVLPAGMRLLRRAARRIVRQAGVDVPLDVTGWHTYALDWQPGLALFHVDEAMVLETDCTPNPPLGFVLWVDNQYAALPPGGRPGFGTLENPEPAWLEVSDFHMA